MAALTPGYLSSLSSIFSPDPSFLPPSSQPVARYRVSRVGRPKYHRVSSFFSPLSLSFPSIDKLPLVSSPHRINISASAGSRSTRQVGIENFRFFDSFSRALSKFFFFLKASRGREEREREKKWQQLQGLDFIIAVDINLVVINAAYYFRITNCAKWRKPGLLKSVETLGGRRFSELVRIIASI